jgi:hypothetical protein
MTLPFSPNTITINYTNVELGYASGGALNLDNSAVRALFGKPTPQSTISLSDGWGKSASAPILDITLTVNTAQVGYSVKQAIIDAGYPSSGKYRVTVIVNAPIGGAPGGGGGPGSSYGVGSPGFYSGGGWQTGETLKIINNSYIVAGRSTSPGGWFGTLVGGASVQGYNGNTGGIALWLDTSLVGKSVTIDNTNGWIYGGGGSGGMGGGYTTAVVAHGSAIATAVQVDGQWMTVNSQRGGGGGAGAGFDTYTIIDGTRISGTTGQSGNQNIITTAWHLAPSNNVPTSWWRGKDGAGGVSFGNGVTSIGNGPVTAAGGMGGSPSFTGNPGTNAPSQYNCGGGGGGGGAGGPGGKGGYGWGYSSAGINGIVITGQPAGGTGGAAGYSVKNGGVSINWVYPGGNRIYGGDLV